MNKHTTILLADDHTIVRDGLRALLVASGGFDIVGTAGNGREAVIQSLKLNPDIVVMDITMPDLDGIEATRRIVERCPKTRVLVLSMHLSSEHIFRAFQAGAQAYVLKESAGEELVEAIRVVCAGRRYLSKGIAETMIDDYLTEGNRGSPLDSLSVREREVLQQVVDGRTNAAIAQSLSLSPKTIETYRSRIMKKLQVHDTVDLVKFAMRHGIAT